jgi:homoserine O-acetyltransferase
MKTAIVVALWLLACCAHAAPVPTEGDFVVENFEFRSGETLPALELHYRTLGELKVDPEGHATNAVLILHGTGGTGAQFMSPQFADELFGPGQPLDAAKFYIVLPDGIGHGQSSKPSDGLHAKFPHYDYDDMVRAQHRLLTERLKVDHLRLLMGTSMGGMHTWVWAETHPDFMDAALPLASLPVQIAGRNRIWRRMLMGAITSDPQWNHGDYVEQPRGLIEALHVLYTMGSSPLQIQKQAPDRDAADKAIDDWTAGRLKTTDANDLLYQVDASRNYDPQPKLESIRAPRRAINSADDQSNPPERGHLEREIKRVHGARAVVIPISDATRGHGTHTWAAVWKAELVELLARTERTAR